MNRYEVLLLTVPEITADEAKSIEQQVDRVVVERKGSMISYERWGKYRLEYPVQNHDYGIYFLVRFESQSPELLVDEVNTLFGVKLHEIIMRFMVTKLDNKQSLAYQRPQSLEEAPSREVGSFMKENKADNLMASDNEAEENEL